MKRNVSEIETVENYDMENVNNDTYYGEKVTDIQKRIKDYLNTEIRKRNDSQKSLAEKTGITESKMTGLLHNSKRISIDDLCAMADAYDLSLDEICGRSIGSGALSDYNIGKWIIELDEHHLIEIEKRECKHSSDPNETHWRQLFGNGKDFYTYALAFPLDSTIGDFIGNYIRVRDAFGDDLETADIYEQNKSWLLNRLLETD